MLPDSSDHTPCYEYCQILPLFCRYFHDNLDADSQFVLSQTDLSHKSDRHMTRLSQLIIRIFLTVFMAAAGLPAAASALSGLDGEPVRFSLLPAVSGTGQLDSLPLALKAELAKGWKIYWRSPGDAGLPPHLNLADSTAAEQKKQLEITMDFPVPGRFSLFGLDTYGYGDEVIFPVTLSGHRPGQPLDVSFAVDALVCSDICVPVAGELDLSLPAAPARASTHAQEIARYRARVPGPGTGQDIGVLDVYLAADKQALVVTLNENSPQIVDIFIETEVPGYGFARPQRRNSNDYEIPISGLAQTTALLGKPLRMTLKSSDQFKETAVASLSDRPVQKPATAGSRQGGSQADAGAPGSYFLGSYFLASMLIIAFGGGLILNIMPCVLPVLSLKLSGLISMGGQGYARSRQRLLAGAAGIITSFAGLGGVLAVFKAGGAQLGWGVQFQNHWFLAALIIVMAVFMLSLLDRVTVRVPALAGQGRSSGLAGDFASGALATILATPCSAPLVGTAISFGFAAPPAQLFAVMLAMGTGLAAPWLLLAVFPHLIRFLPAPGRWLGWVKPVLAAGLGGTVIWLGWLFAGAAGLTALAVLSISLAVFAGLICFAPARQAWAGASTVLVAGLIAVGFVVQTPQIQPGSRTDNGLWQQWSPARIDSALADGQAVFVDVTADWCITCQVNKRLVLGRDDIVAGFDRADVLRLQADWTLPDQAIADYLAGFNRFGIPFNILYLPNGQGRVIFGELLSAEKILTALDKINN